MHACAQAMKINAKLDGVNTGLAQPPFTWVAKPFMVLGASLSHKGARPSAPCTVSDRVLFAKQLPLAGLDAHTPLWLDAA